jgi:Ser/Thr protein kinase RdoA (MazF antagonist)
MLKVGLEEHPSRLAPEFAAIASRYVADPDGMHASWQSGPTTVIHGDPHIGNLFNDGGRTGFLDWGIISTGTPLRDVSYFLCMALSIDDRRRHERDLLRHYLDLWNAGTELRISFDDAWLAHRVHAAYTVLACCQIVTFPERLPPVQRTFSQAFLARASAAVADLETLSAL